MNKRYIVKKAFEFGGSQYHIGQELSLYEVNSIPKDIIDDVLFTQDFSDINLALSFGLIFHSKVFPMQQYHEEETQTEILCRLQSEAKGCDTPHGSE